MAESERKTMPCGCEADAARDFLGRVVGTIVVKGEGCRQVQHALGRVVPMPGRENARPE